jgi:hypothetical protein
MLSTEPFFLDPKLKTALRFNADQPSKNTGDYELISLPIYLSPLYRKFIDA